MNTMDISQAHSWRSWLTGLVIVTSLLAGGCSNDGSDGAAGPTGPTGPGGPVVLTELPATVVATITGASVAADGSLTVNFSIKDDRGFGFIGLKGSDMRFTVAQLQSAGSTGDGEPSKWQSYINTTENPKVGVGTGTQSKTQATYEKGNGGGVFTDNGDGTYSYTLKMNLKAVTTPVAVTYDAALTHRVGIQFDGDLSTINELFDWQPSTGATTGIDNRLIVAEEACNGCHGQLALHGSRVDTDYCVTCHNPGTADANSGNTVDFKVMVHKIHRGEHLQEVKDGGAYTIFGYRDAEHDYSEVVFPQDLRNCLTCHDESNLTTPQASNWRKQPTIEACGSCHDDVDFATGTNHGGGVQADNKDCIGCHGEGSVVSPIDARHTGVMTSIDALRDIVEVSVLEVTVTSAATPSSPPVSGDMDVQVKVAMTLDGQPVNRVVEFGTSTDTVQGAQLGKYGRGTDNGALAVNWDDGTGFQTNHREANFNDCDAAANGSGEFTCTISNLGAIDNSGSTTDVLTIVTVDLLVCHDDQGDLDSCPVKASGESNADFEERLDQHQVEVTPTIASFKGDGTVATSGYDKIGASMTNCQSCHGDKQFHHGSTDLVQCKTCHNATRTGFRGLGDLKRHVHRLHSGLDHDALDDPDANDIVDKFPSNVDNCNACHATGQFDLPIDKNDRASIAAGPSGDVYISPTAVVCGSCHISQRLGKIDPTRGDYMDPAQGTLTKDERATVDHMVQNGAIFGASTFALANKAESCSVCHAIGNEFGVDVVHNLK